MPAPKPLIRRLHRDIWKIAYAGATVRLFGGFCCQCTQSWGRPEILLCLIIVYEFNGAKVIIPRDYARSKNCLSSSWRWVSRGAWAQAF
jgi:hypothetical protein